MNKQDQIHEMVDYGYTESEAAERLDMPKEVIISALGILYSSGGTIVSALLAAWTIPQVISFLIFQMTYAPCFATIATMKSESKSWKLTALGFFYPLILTTIITTIVYHLLVLVMG